MSAAPAGAIRLVLVGATGRMGGQILRELARHPRLRLIGAVASERSRALGEDAAERAGLPASGVRISAALAPLLARADLVLDFSLGAVVERTLSECSAARVPLLFGATGLPPSLDSALRAAAACIPVLVAANTSLGVNLLLELVSRAAKTLPASFDIEILESHHRLKRDAPSGTALALGQAAAEARGRALEPLRDSRAGERSAGQIGFAVIRGGDVVGEHQVLFLGEGESLKLSHRATDRAIFARGALQAGLWLVRQPPGRYAMRDFLSATVE